MARGSIQFSPSSRPGLMGDVGAAAGLASVAESRAGLRVPDYGSMGADAIGAESAKRRAVYEGNAEARAGVLKNVGYVEAERIKAEAQKEAAQAKASGSMFGSIAKAGIGLIGSALISDKKTKNNIENIEDALAVLRELRPVTFYYNEEYSSSPERLHHGFIAQEYAKHMPDATYYDESIDSMCIDTVELIALLVRSVQQLETKVARMEAQSALAGVK